MFPSTPFQGVGIHTRFSMKADDTLLIDRNNTGAFRTVPIRRLSFSSVFWHRLGLGTVLLLAAFLNFYRLDQMQYGNTYYAAGVKSMLMNWHNFFFVSFDPGGFVTIDKPPLGFWIQALSAKIFGFSGFSLLLPEAIAGILSVAVLYRLVARSFGRGTGLLAALALAVTPISVVTNRNNTIDSLLVLTLLFATWAVSVAAETGKLRWLLVCALLVGLGFNIKMLQAYLVVPAFGLLYLLAAPRRWWTRVWHLALSLVLMLVVSFTWITIVDLTPPSQRPFVGSSPTNSALDLAIGYNGLQRLLGRNASFTLPNGGGPCNDVRHTRILSVQVLSVLSQTQRLTALEPNEAILKFGDKGNSGIFRLFNITLGGQIAWLLPFALLGMLALGWQTRPRIPLDKHWQALILWGVCLLTMVVFFSNAQFFNTYYLVMMGPALCALFGIGVVMMWQDYRRTGWRGWFLPLALLVTACVQISLLASFPSWSVWMTPIIGVLCLLVAAGLLVIKLLERVRRSVAFPEPAPRLVIVSRTFVVLGVFALLFAPLVWSSFSVIVHGDRLTTQAGPNPQEDVTVVSKQSAPRRNAFGPTTLVRYLLAKQGETPFLLATLSTGPAAPIILETGKPVMAMGGFSGSNPILTVPKLRALVQNRTVRFFLLQSSLARNNALVRWVSTNCSTVSTNKLSEYTAVKYENIGIPGGNKLYDCDGV